MADSSAPEATNHQEHHLELRKEGLTTAFYVAIFLLAALIALPAEQDQFSILGVMWGVTIGLAAAHWFAFRLSTKLVGAGEVSAGDLESGAVQLAGAAAVAALCSLPALLLPESVEVRIVALLLAVSIAAVGYFVARGGGASRFRSIAYALIVLVVAVAVAELKNLLAGH